ncbi:MAG: UDP-N-acetylglucosamine 2-epimerase (non-hydrolyzing) [Candidatus Competibacteraceae bacterium]|nr:UDP-N-acetylglucosamine 2-epimerase (non-hydrolyzing) [Candidatus Competibacteraceae bacterium]
MTATSAKILCVVGARPNFMKIAPIMAALRQTPGLEARLVHTGQHYDVEMNQRFFEQLGIPNPDIDLEVGSASHAVQTAEIMKRFEPVMDAEQPAAVLVVGDVNSTIACALVAAKKGVRIVHVEAGLRSFDRTMPEEINRVLTDQISDLLFTTEREALTNLTREGVDPTRVQFVGNVMIDTLRSCLPRAVPPEQALAGASDPAAFLNGPNGYGILTLHRPSNVDDPVVLERLLKVLGEISAELPLAFPVHPRTRSIIDKAGLGALLDSPHFYCLPPQGYLEMLGLMQGARLALTDSGGVQEETTALGIPCLTLRENTERPVTVTEGTNTIVGADPERIRQAARDVLTSGGKAGRIPEYWDGRAAERIAAKLAKWL